MKPKTIRLFIKPGCPWCDEAIDWLDERGLAYETLDVISDSEARLVWTVARQRQWSETGI